jgi:hypothetical protein
VASRFDRPSTWPGPGGRYRSPATVLPASAGPALTEIRVPLLKQRVGPAACGEHMHWGSLPVRSTVQQL